jgi:hypothetical protein
MYRKLGIKTVEDESSLEVENHEMDERLIEKKLDIQATN